MASRDAQIASQPSSRLVTHLYTHSYLILFAILGTLARLGVEALTTYPNAPVTFTVLWANVGGSFIMGFLIEDQKLFRSREDAQNEPTEMFGPENRKARHRASPAAKSAHLARKKAIPLYIGLATGFCGSFTSFSTFIRDMFLATTDDLAPPGSSGSSASSRNGGYSFLALLAVLISTIALSISALITGFHAATAVHPITPSLPQHFLRRYFDRLAVVLGPGCWLAAILLSIFPPHDRWRSQALFALVFAPPGCLLRYHLGVLLNPRIPSFPLGTFLANAGGTAVLGMAWDLIHAPVGGLVACQVLLGIEDGFCGCLTTVSTWVAELVALKSIRHAYLYGTVSVVASYALLIVIMGGLRWSDGFGVPRCS